jgi:hypothetical protein
LEAGYGAWRHLLWNEIPPAPFSKEGESPEASYSPLKKGAGDFGIDLLVGLDFVGSKVLKNGSSGRQPRRAAFWKAQHIARYVSICKTSRNAGSRPDEPFF